MATDWKKIKAEYIRGGTSYRELAKKYGVSFSTLCHTAHKEKWTDLRQKTSKNLDTKLAESVAKKEAKRVDKIETIADMLLDMIQQGIASGDIDITSKRGYRDITGALKDIREIKGMKSDLDIQEQKARIDKLRREAREEQESKDIKVIISGGLDEYAQ